MDPDHDRRGAAGKRDSKLKIYRVRPGDEIRTIAQRLGVPVMALCRENRIRPGDELQAGQALRVPSRKARRGAGQEKATGKPPSARPKKGKLREPDLIDPFAHAMLGPGPSPAVKRPETTIPPLPSRSSRPPSQGQTGQNASSVQVPLPRGERGLLSRRRRQGMHPRAGGSPGAGKMFGSTQTWEPTQMLRLSDLAADGDDSFRRLDEKGKRIAGKEDTDLFKSLGAAVEASDASDSFRLASTDPDPHDGTDKFTDPSGEKPPSEGDLFRRYRSPTDRPGQEKNDGSPGDACAASSGGERAVADELRASEIKIGSLRVAVPSSLLTRGLTDPSRSDPIFASALESGIQEGRTLKVTLGPDLHGPQSTFRELGQLEERLDRLEIRRSRKGHVLALSKMKGTSPLWGNVRITESYQFIPSKSGDLTRLMLYLARPQPAEFLENLKLIKRELLLRHKVPIGRSALISGFRLPGKWKKACILVDWLKQLEGTAGSLTCSQDARAPGWKVVQEVDTAVGIHEAMAGLMAPGESFAGPRGQSGEVWNHFLVPEWGKGGAGFLGPLAGPVPDEHRALCIGWAIDATEEARLQFRVLLGNRWATSVLSLYSDDPGAGEIVEAVWTVSSRKWIHRPRVVEVLWETATGDAPDKTRQMAETFADSFYRHAEFVLLAHVQRRRIFQEAARLVLREPPKLENAVFRKKGVSPREFWKESLD